MTSDVCSAPQNSTEILTIASGKKISYNFLLWNSHRPRGSCTHKKVCIERSHESQEPQPLTVTVACTSRVQRQHQETDTSKNLQSSFRFHQHCMYTLTHMCGGMHSTQFHDFCTETRQNPPSPLFPWRCSSTATAIPPPIWIPGNQQSVLHLPNFIISRIPYKWNHTAYNPLRLFSLSITPWEPSKLSHAPLARPPHRAVFHVDAPVFSIIHHWRTLGLLSVRGYYK